MKPIQLLQQACVLAYTLLPLSAADTAYPPPYGIESCGTPAIADDLVPIRREVYGGGRIVDITYRLHPDMPAFESADGVGQIVSLPASMKNGSLANNSEMKLPAHTGTHVDAPGHVYDHYFDAGFDVDTLDLDVLNGQALLVDVPRDTNITGFTLMSELLQCRNFTISSQR